MIEDIAKVVRLEGDNAYIEVERTAACAQCGLQEVEEMAAGGKAMFMALNIAKADVGDIVKVRVESVAYIKAYFFVYGIPILLLIAGAITGFYIDGRYGVSSDTMSAVLGMAGLIIGMGVLFIFRKRGSKKKYMPIIAEVIKE